MANTTNTTSYLDPPSLIGRLNNDGTISLTPLELKRLNDFNYAVAKMIQGGLNLANLNADTKQVFTDIEGNIASVQATAEGLETRVSNAEGDISSLQQTANGLSTRVSNAEGSIVTAQQTANSASVTASNALGQAQSVKLTVDGLTVADETGSYTIIDGDKLESRDHYTGNIVRIENGEVTSADYSKHLRLNEGGIYLGGSTSYEPAMLYYEPSSGKFLINSASGLKLQSGTNMSIDSYGTIYIGASSGYSGNVNIGQSGGIINLNGTVMVNGVPYAPAGGGE